MLRKAMKAAVEEEDDDDDDDDTGTKYETTLFFVRNRRKGLILSVDRSTIKARGRLGILKFWLLLYNYSYFFFFFWGLAQKVLGTQYYMCDHLSIDCPAFYVLRISIDRRQPCTNFVIGTILQIRTHRRIVTPISFLDGVSGSKSVCGKMCEVLL